MPKFEQSARLAQLASNVISKHDKVKHLDDPSIRIAYMTSDNPKKSRGKVVYAETEKINDKYKVLLPYDFIVMFYWPNCENLTDEKLEKLMYHELLHVGVSGDGTFSIVPHDVEDFRDVIDRWGIDWI